MVGAKSRREQAEAAQIACTIIVSADRLASVGKSVHDVGKDDEKLHEQCVGGQHHVALCRASGGKVGGDGDEAECAQKYVAVDGKEAFELRHITHLTPFNS